MVFRVGLSSRLTPSELATAFGCIICICTKQCGYADW